MANKLRFNVFDMHKSMNVALSMQELRKFAKARLKENKRIGYDKDVTLRDFKENINVVTYTNNIGLLKNITVDEKDYRMSDLIYRGNQIFLKGSIEPLDLFK